VNMLASVTIRRARNPPAVSLRFPGPGSSSQGKSGPKIRPKGVVDGKLVNIPVPILFRLNDGGTEKDRSATLWLVPKGRGLNP
jgi:hypothetical protein